MIINATNMTALFAAYNAAYNKGFNAYAPVHEKVATVVPSASAENTYAWLGSVPDLREWIGERQYKNLQNHSYSIRNKKFEGTVPIPVEDIEDDQYGVHAPAMESMGKKAAEHPDKLVFGALKDGFTGKCYDGGAFFGNHKVGKATVSNMTAGTDPAWFLLDCTQPLKPMIFQKRREYRLIKKDDPLKSDTVFNKDVIIYGCDARVNAGYGFWQMAHGSKAELTKASLRDAYKQMRALQGDNGEKLNLRPSLLVVPDDLMFAARDILLAEKLDSGASNTDFKLVDYLDTAYVA